MFRSVAETYRRTRKPNDILWNRWVARPLAAAVLVPLARTSVTPNQVTLLTLVVFVGAAGLLIGWPGQAGLVSAVAVLEFSYVLDCVDGQLARLRGISTPVGAHLDFLMDELKAFLLVGAVSVRLWRADGRPGWLVEGLAGLLAVASAISLTTFMRRPEYTALSASNAPAGRGDYGQGFAAPAAAPDGHRSFFALIEAAGRLVIHYPSYMVLIAAVNRADVFLHAYVFMNAGYAARSLASIALRLGRPNKAPTP